MKFSFQRVTRQIEFPDASARAWEDVCTQDVCADPGDRSSLLLLWGGTTLLSYVGGGGSLTVDASLGVERL